VIVFDAVYMSCTNALVDIYCVNLQNTLNARLGASA
jgi:hypothetical protein